MVRAPLSVRKPVLRERLYSHSALSVSCVPRNAAALPLAPGPKHSGRRAVCACTGAAGSAVHASAESRPSASHERRGAEGRERDIRWGTETLLGIESWRSRGQRPRRVGVHGCTLASRWHAQPTGVSTSGGGGSAGSRVGPEKRARAEHA